MRDLSFERFCHSRRGVVLAVLLGAAFAGCGGGGSPGKPPAAGPGGSGGTPMTGGGGGAGGLPDPTPPASDAAPPPSPTPTPAPTPPPTADAAPEPAGDAAACGLAGQACCPGNTCAAGATAAMTAGTPGAGTTVLELKASGGDPYAYFASKSLLPIDGPSSGFITDTGTSFQFVLHQNGAEETVSSGASRQRNELTVNPGNPAMYKGLKGDTMSYTWRFKLDKMNAEPTWCDIFQVKQHGPLGVAPYMALEAYKSDLTIDTQRAGVVAKIPLTTIMGIWINASLTVTYADAGSIALSLTKDDGTAVLTYNNKNIDLSDGDVDFVRPKWGLYRNKAGGAGEAAIQYNDMKIIRGTVGAAPACSCKN